MERHSLDLDMDDVEARLERLQECEHTPAVGQCLLVYAEAAHGEVEHPALTALTKTPKGGLGGVFSSRPALYEVTDQRNLADAVMSVGAYGFASIFELPDHRRADVLRLVRDKKFGTSIPKQASPLPGLIPTGEPFWEVSTWLEGTPMRDGREETFLVITHSGLAPEMARFLDALGT